MREEWLVASLATAIADSVDDASNAVQGHARRKRIAAEIRALEADPERRAESIAKWRATLEKDSIDDLDEGDEAGFNRWIAMSLDVLQPMTLDEWMDRLWLARRWRELAGPIMSVSALLDRRSPFSLR